MIINTGARTDTVQYYAPWLLRRFEEGYVLARNPLFPNKVTRYELDPAVVDCVVFCSKDYRPILPHLHQITDRFSTYFYYTITAYGRDIGAYDTCPNGCRYCYANKDHKRAAENYRLHDPASPLLIGSLRPGDTVTQGVQKSLLARGGQRTLGL